MNSILAALRQFFRWLWHLIAGKRPATGDRHRLIRFVRVPLARRKGGHSADAVQICTPSGGMTVGTTFTVTGYFDEPDTDVTCTLTPATSGATITKSVAPSGRPRKFTFVVTGAAPGSTTVTVTGTAPGGEHSVTVVVSASMATTDRGPTLCLGVSDNGPFESPQYMRAVQVERGNDKLGDVGFWLELHGAKAAAFEVGIVLEAAGDTLVDYQLGERRIADPKKDGETWIASYAGVKTGSYPIQIEGADGVKDKVVINVHVID